QRTSLCLGHSVRTGSDVGDAGQAKCTEQCHRDKQWEIALAGAQPAQSTARLVTALRRSKCDLSVTRQARGSTQAALAPSLPHSVLASPSRQLLVCATVSLLRLGHSHGSCIQGGCNPVYGPVCTACNINVMSSTHWWKRPTAPRQRMGRGNAFCSRAECRWAFPSRTCRCPVDVQRGMPAWRYTEAAFLLEATSTTTLQCAYVRSDAAQHEIFLGVNT